MTLWLGASIIAASFVVMLFYRAYMHADLLRLARYEHWSDRFYSAAKPLVANPETPANIISLVESLNDLMTYKDAPFGIARVFARRLEKGLPVRKDAEGAPEDYKSFFKKYPELLDNAQAVTKAGLLAPTYVRLVGGTQARAVLADLFCEMDLRHNEIGDAFDVRSVSKINRGPSLVPHIIRR
ncbi:hypothetical protein [Bradyrhizobium sp. AUGA SZCCT0431]|uniref:hypothetical protein n=1 Tax=Bradyrhizobium sp. AUGA SZCCT0431 TaxID=2807674 RepID=UPI001BA6AF89|nr:hypothetical protein [Bradyrhizobium sp. AUGA SZCCT0431]MBR1142293.1 hypothetical protein [Bradyrhizobium sp. AUGA SZCCT0431]